jgi:hypothetical protein
LPVPKDGFLRAGGRQARGRDGDDLSQTASDPGRRGAQQFAQLSHFRTVSNRAGRNDRPANKSVRLESGPVRPACRYSGENSNASIVRSAPGSGFIAAIGPAAGKIFSAKIRRAPSMRWPVMPA